MASVRTPALWEATIQAPSHLFRALLIPRASVLSLAHNRWLEYVRCFGPWLRLDHDQPRTAQFGVLGVSGVQA